MSERETMDDMNRREFLKGAVLGVGSALMGASRAGAAQVEDRKVRSLDLRITCTTEILRRSSGKRVNLWVPVPPDDREQEVKDLSVSSHIPHQTTQDDVWQNRMIHFSADTLRAGDKIVLTYRVRRKTVGVLNDPQEKNPQRYLVPSEWEKWDDAVAKFADHVVGRETDPVKIARMAYDAIIDRISYAHEACGRGVSAFTLEEGTGRCDEFHALFRSMLMYKRIPVKWEEGILLPYPSVMKKTGELEQDCLNAHSWVKFYAGAGKWMPADLSEAKRRPELRDYCFGRISPNRIKMSNERGVNLNPKQEGIINTFSSPYAEADGIPLIYSHHYRTVMRYEVAGMELLK